MTWNISVVLRRNFADLVRQYRLYKIALYSSLNAETLHYAVVELIVFAEIYEVGIFENPTQACTITRSVILKPFGMNLKGNVWNIHIIIYKTFPRHRDTAVLGFYRDPAIGIFSTRGARWMPRYQCCAVSPLQRYWRFCCTKWLRNSITDLPPCHHSIPQPVGKVILCDFNQPNIWKLTVHRRSIPITKHFPCCYQH